MRLVDGRYSSDGRLEVFIFGMWYSICTDELPSEAANAVCTQLGYTHSIDIDLIRFVKWDVYANTCIYCILQIVQGGEVLQFLRINQ